MPTIPHLRLASQQIAQRRYTTPREVVAALGAIQAQDYAGALWSIGLRLAEPTVVELAPFGAVGVDGWRERVGEYGRFLGLEGVVANQNGGET